MQELRRLGHDVLTAHEAGQANQAIQDPDVLAFAIAQARTLLNIQPATLHRLHRRVQPHNGILICTRDDDIAALAGRIDKAIVSGPSLGNQLLRINKP